MHVLDPGRHYVLDELFDLNPNVSEAQNYSYLNKTFHESGFRPHLLEKIQQIMPILVAAGGTDCLKDISRSIQDVANWWP